MDAFSVSFPFQVHMNMEWRINLLLYQDSPFAADVVRLEEIPPYAARERQD